MRPRLVLVSMLSLICLGMGPCSVSEFDLGVGAFEVGQRRAILWTHVVPEDPDTRSVMFSVQVATDENFDDVVRARAVTAKQKHDFTTQALITGLDPEFVVVFCNSVAIEIEVPV